MKMRVAKSIVGIISAGLILTISPNTSSAVSSVDEQWVPSYQTDYLRHALAIQDSSDGRENFSHLWAQQFTNDGKFLGRYVCHSTSDRNCENPTNYEYVSILPNCDMKIKSNCIEEFLAIDKDGKVLNPKFLSYTTNNQPDIFKGDSKFGIPNPAMPGIWNIPGAEHAAGNQYVVNIGVAGTTQVRGGVSIDQTLFASVTAVQRISNPGILNGSASHLQCFGGQAAGTSTPNANCSIGSTPRNADYKCEFDLFDSPECLAPQAFPEGIKFKVSILLENEPAGWIHGRMNDPQISITKQGSQTLISVEAAPTKVPVVFTSNLWSELTQKERDFWIYRDQCQHGGSVDCGTPGNWGPVGTYDQINLPSIDKQSLFTTYQGYGETPLKAISAFAERVSEKSVAEPSRWSFHTLPSGQLANSNSCIKNGEGVKGIVTTNSTAYSAGPPQFTDSSLQYKVASMHFTKDGSVFKGTYNLIIRKDVARCLYGFTSAPISAKIQILSETPEATVATTTFTEKGNWDYLSANGFTFSSPIIKVTLKQDKATPSEGDKPQDQLGKPGKEISIICSRGKSRKTVTSIKPKCPAGYKKS